MSESPVERLRDELEERNHLEYVEIEQVDGGDIVVRNVAPESSHFNNAEFAAIYSAGLHPIHVECETEEVYLDVA